MPFTCDLAGDVNGVKRNLRVEFLAPPALHDITRAAESLFTLLLRSDAAERALSDESRGNSSRRPHERVSDLFFTVESVAVRDEGRDVWVAVRSGSQVRTGAQLYCFQPKRRHYTPVAAAAPTAEKQPPPLLAELVPSASSLGCGYGKPGGGSGVVVVDALVVEEMDPDSPGELPPPEHTVVWGRGTAALFASESTLPSTVGQQHEGPCESRSLEERLWGQDRRVSPSPPSPPLTRSSAREWEKERERHRPQPMFLRSTESSARKTRVVGSESETDDIHFISHRRQQEQRRHRQRQRQQQQQRQDAHEDLVPAKEERNAATEPLGKQTTSRPPAPMSPSPSPFPIPAASLYTEPRTAQHPKRAVSPPPSPGPHQHQHQHQQQQGQGRRGATLVGFSERVRLVFVALPTEAHRPFLLLRDLFHFAKMHGLLSRDCLLGEQRARRWGGGGEDGDGDGANPSPFFVDRLRESHGLSLEGVLRAADLDRDGCLTYQEWLGFCLERPQVLELFFLFLQHGGPSDGPSPSASSPLWGGYHYTDPSATPLHFVSPVAKQPQQWEITHLSPPRSGPPRCEACHEIVSRSAHAFPLQYLVKGQPTSRRRGHGGEGRPDRRPAQRSPRSQLFREGGELAATQLTPPWPRRLRERLQPYPTAMPFDDFSRRVTMMSVYDALAK